MSEKEPKKDDREDVTVKLIPRAQAAVSTIREDTGVPKTEAIARLLEWFATTDPKLRLAILNRQESQRDELLVAWVREQLGTKGIKADALTPADVAGRVRLMKKMLDEMHAQYEGVKHDAHAKRK